MDPNDLRDQLARMVLWHHNVELVPDVWTNPRMGNHPTARWALIEPYVPSDLHGMTVLDVGCSSGFFGAMLKRRGADRVVAVDVVDSAIAEARLLTSVWRTPIEIVQQDVYEFLAENRTSFDLVVFLGLFYHLRSPLFVLDRLAEITRQRMYFQTWVRNEPAALIGAQRLLFACYELAWLVKHRAPGQAITSAMRSLLRPLSIPEDLDVDRSYLMSHPDWPKMRPIQNLANDDPTNWWVCDTRTIKAILATAGFRRVQPLSEDTFICDAITSEARS